jgi:hypothetical protein
VTLGLQHALGEGFPTAALADRQRLHVLLQVEVHELEDQIQLVPVGVHDVKQTQHVRVVHLLEQADLADRSRRDALIFGLETDLLQRDDAVVGRAEVARLVHDSVGALADLFHFLFVSISLSPVPLTHPVRACRTW